MKQVLGKLHFIAIGGNVMHALAIACKNMGYEVSGSDDQIYEPSYGKLESEGILPDKMGWDANRIDDSLDAIILGMHAKKDNPELLRAQELGKKIYSFPEFMFNLSKDKQRIVIAGSHGKTTITAIIMHVLNFHNRKFDYVVGAPVDGFSNLVRVSDSPIIIIEGDEYFSSVIDPKPKLSHYHQHIGLLSGVAWDHINVFPTIDSYVGAFEDFADRTPKAGSFAYYEDDPIGSIIGNKDRFDVFKLPYNTHPHKVIDGKTLLTTSEGNVEINIFGEHNLQNISGALEVLKRIGVNEKMFYNAIGSFQGAYRRMELISQEGDTKIYLDYAHSPSKVTATVSALKKQYPDQQLTAIFELHTFSSLDPDFIKGYKNALKNTDKAYVFVNPSNLKLQDENGLTDEVIVEAFHKPKPTIIRDISELEGIIADSKSQSGNILLMSSGNFGGIDLNQI